MSSFTDISADQLRQFMATNHEKNYRLVDVREDKEYAAEHIPGAQLMPLSSFGDQLHLLPESGDVVFYCRSGQRSRAAARLFLENRGFSGRVFNLAGGILDWKGLTLPDFPNFRLFQTDGSAREIFYQAMDLERGAFHYYSEVLHRYPREPFSPAITRLARAEEEHARLIYSCYRKETPEAPPFEELYGSLPGELVEGGHSLATLKKLLNNLPANPCVDIVELAVGIEYSAYDLYRNMATRFSDDSQLQDTFLTIAQAEKEHMRQAAAMLKLCEL